MRRVKFNTNLIWVKSKHEYVIYSVVEVNIRME